MRLDFVFYSLLFFILVTLATGCYPKYATIRPDLNVVDEEYINPQNGFVVTDAVICYVQRQGYSRVMKYLPISEFWPISEDSILTRLQYSFDQLNMEVSFSPKVNLHCIDSTTVYRNYFTPVVVNQSEVAEIIRGKNLTNQTVLLPVVGIIMHDEYWYDTGFSNPKSQSSLGAQLVIQICIIQDGKLIYSNGQSVVVESYNRQDREVSENPIPTYLWTRVINNAIKGYYKRLNK